MPKKLIPILLALAVLAPLAMPASPASAAPKSFFGVLPIWNLKNKDFKRLSGNNINTVRFNLEWQLVQPEQGGKYDWSYFDRMVRLGAKHGVRVLPLLYGTPSYHADLPTRPPIYSQAAIEGWGKFVRAAVERYGARGKFWQARPHLKPRSIRQWFVWNEPNLSSFFHPEANARQYSFLLWLTASAIREVNPKATVVASGLQGLSDNPPGRIAAPKFLQQMYDLGADEYFDMVDIHPYGRNRARVREHVQVMRRVMNRNRDWATPLYASEIGWATHTSNGQRNQVTTNMRGQARKLRTTMRMLLNNRKRWNLRGVLWFTYRDQDYPTCFWCGGAGLFRENGKPKPAWRAYRKITNRRR